MTEGKSKSIWRSSWPKIDDIESAKFATLYYGFFGATFCSVLAAIFATISLFSHQSILGLDAWSYIDALLLGIVAWRVKNYSRAFAIGGIALGVGNVIAKLLEPRLYPPSAFAGAIFVLIVYFINGARGVFAYNRFKPTSIWGESSHSGESSKLSGTAPAVKTKSTDSATEDKFFEQALTEVESGQTVKAIWARSLASAEGDVTKTKALYIRFRVDNLKLLSVEGSTQYETKTKEESQLATKKTKGRLNAPVILVAVIVIAVISIGAVSIFNHREEERAVTGFRNMLTEGSYLANENTAAMIRRFLASKKGTETENVMAQNLLRNIPRVMAEPRDFLSSLPRVIFSPPTSDELKAAAQGDSEAQYRVGFLYTTSVAPDDEQAVFWLERAAMQGHAHAQYDLGGRYFSGQGVAKDYRQAVLWYEKAAEQGLDGAQRDLGNMYFEGDGLAQNLVEAHKWLSLAGRGGGKYESERREKVEQKMTQKQISDAIYHASEWIKAHK